MRVTGVKDENKQGTMKNRIKKAVMPLLLALVATSCTSDLYYAGSFLRKFEQGKSTATEKIYVHLPESMIHTNSSLNEVPGFMLMSEQEQDSVIASKTAIVDKIDDSIFLSQFNSAFLFTLSRTRIPIVLVGDASKMPKADDQHFTVDFVQMEAEEYMEPCTSSFKTRNGLNYRHDYDLRHFSLNVWMKLDARDSVGEVFFKNEEIGETFRGRVLSIEGGHASMQADYERIDVNDAYRVARRLGSLCATLYVEKILSEYVCRTKGTNQTYFIYDPWMNTIESLLPYSEGAKESFEKL